jgi:amino-acid N-acetyltransferase
MVGKGIAVGGWAAGALGSQAATMSENAHRMMTRLDMSAEYSRDAKTRNIRPATEADDVTIHKLIRDEHLDPTSLKWQNFLVAEQDGKIVGIGQVKEYPGCQELGSLVILQEYRRKGIAAELIAALEARAGRPLYLFTRAVMDGYYARFGYKQIRYWDAPWFLKLKMLVPLTFRVFGVRIIIMRKD